MLDLHVADFVKKSWCGTAIYELEPPASLKDELQPERVSDAIKRVELSIRTTAGCPFFHTAFRIKDDRYDSRNRDDMDRLLGRLREMIDNMEKPNA